MTLLWIFAGLLGVAVFAQAYQRLKIAAMRRNGLYPAAGQATIDDVRRFAATGHTAWAIRCYREIHPVGLKEAHAAIAKLADQ
ncbi:hypothetical protein [Uliginosibacterium aquaticum]|uniref:Uncharacterized protein n=1 Tax=Uliginosibacterium aquaticum TaxID=2731212 RepID=A0ABX2IIS3_9RHOO|nr:hypothetical protein [Uliginosibacterium aquaticum]NSL55768.1 hypothetical protein [Uliginosibacterium aquaticum]